MELLSPGKIILILLFAFLMFGPKKLPELGKAAGKTLMEFKKATNNVLDNEEQKETSEKTSK
ncbi:sec-independent protein translocase protein TatA [Scopulibacillus darangshiensis]|uniref:Sec-independent protein translocase protein TatA n=1 Tax=Scopulibacillus darangshiensis TaxID=442528 RepID=A0A4R2P454_9BACL|nr:twin-arginine translocase TatA/TatE family subunit [Scopulibacillus darangshiensis]TCP28711.1 sec-independent protein translocase protein TatA [Scopulibacillus darangshiensis]